MRAIVFAILALLSGVVYSAPAYLECVANDPLNTNNKKFSLKLDEANGKITHTRANGAAFNTEGFFTANTIAYKNAAVISITKVTQQFEINRENLTLLHTTTLESNRDDLQAPAKIIPEEGSCKVVQVSKKRKI